MLAAAGEDQQVKIFEKRGSKVVQTFDGIHKGNIIFFWFNKSFLISYFYYIDSVSCVRWSPSGDMIASASLDKKVALLDFKTGKKLYTGTTTDWSKFPHFA